MCKAIARVWHSEGVLIFIKKCMSSINARYSRMYSERGLPKYLSFAGNRKLAIANNKPVTPPWVIIFAKHARYLYVLIQHQVKIFVSTTRSRNLFFFYPRAFCLFHKCLIHFFNIYFPPKESTVTLTGKFQALYIVDQGNTPHSAVVTMGIDTSG